MLKRSTCKKLDKILDELKLADYLYITDFFKKNIDLNKSNAEQNKLFQECEYLISKILTDDLACYPDSKTKYDLNITNQGRVFKGYVKERRNKIISITGKYILWIAVVSGGAWAIIEIFNICDCK